MKKGQYLKVRSNCPLLFATTKVGQKVFRHFDPLLHIFRQKLAILDTLEFQVVFFIPENPKKHLTLSLVYFTHFNPPIFMFYAKIKIITSAIFKSY